MNPPMILRHRGEIRLHMWVRNGPKETIIVRRGRTARPAGAPVMRKLERSQQSNGTRAAEAQRAHLTSSNLLSAASICVGGLFRCCTRGTGIESLAATRPGSDVGFPSPMAHNKKKVDGQRMVTLTDTPLLCCASNVVPLADLHVWPKRVAVCARSCLGAVAFDREQVRSIGALIGAISLQEFAVCLTFAQKSKNQCLTLKGGYVRAKGSRSRVATHRPRRPLPGAASMTAQHLPAKVHPASCLERWHVFTIALPVRLHSGCWWAVVGSRAVRHPWLGQHKALPDPRPPSH